jgi:hypothetical protein
MKAKLKKIGNSMYILVPKKIAEPFILVGEIDISFPPDVPVRQELVTPPEKIKKTHVMTSEVIKLPSIEKSIITKVEKILNNGGAELCKKHKGSRKWTCGCK